MANNPLTSGWFNLGMIADAQKNPEKYGLPAPDTGDRPGDKGAPQAAFTDALRKRGASWSEAFRAGVESAAEQGPTVGTAGSWLTGKLGYRGDVPEEARRKLNYAMHQVSPAAHTLGMVSGAPIAAADYAVAGLDALTSGAKYTMGVIGEGVAPIMLRAPEAGAGYLGRLIGAGVNGATRLASATGNKMSTAAKWGTGALAGTLGALVAAAPATRDAAGTTPDKYDGFRFSDDPAMAEQQLKTLNVLRQQEAQSKGEGSAMVLNRVAAGAGGASPAQQYYAQIHTPDGKLREGITPEMEALARVAVQTEALMPGMQVAAPVGMVAGKNGGAVYVPGGEDAQKFWQNQYGEYDAAMAANKGQPVRLSDVLKAGAQGQPVSVGNMPAAVRVGAGDMPAAVPGAFADIIDSYDGGGTMTPEQRQIAEGLAQRERQQIMDNRFVKLGQQLGINDPELAITMGRNGQFTKGMVDANILQQQVRTSTKLDPKDALYQRMQTAIDVSAARVKAMPEGPERDKADAAVSEARKRLETMFITPNAYLGLTTTVNGAE